ncbi:hypothetical protein JYT14_00350 [Flavobacteriales bacterium AH-315-E23]|nr:hypothetical protein [Flavobacteriales bacterium AH-315-E23]
MEILIISILSAAVVLPMMMVNRVFLPSDNKIQLSIVDQIRSNNHRFILKHGSFLFCEKMIYPQFLFWLLSFLSMKNYKRAARYLFVLFHFLSAVAFIAFVLKLYPMMSPIIDLSLSEVLLYTGAVYILTPFSYNINNAKNTGISTRGLGLFLGQVVLYSTVLYIYSNDMSYLILSSLCMWLILIGSAFSLQMLLLVIPAWAIIEGDWIVAAPLLGALVFFFMTTPRYALNYVTGQFSFKIFYFKYLAKNILLTKRYSVWRDFIWDFWKIAFNKFRHNGRITKGLMYIYDNPAVTVIIGVPFCILIITLEWSIASYNGIKIVEHWRWLVSLPILLCFGAFILTSFRLTRFLGEPERYVEFATGLIAVASLSWFRMAPELVTYVLVFCAILTIVQLIGIRLRLKEKSQPGFFDDILQLEDYFEKNEPGTVRILSNNNQISKLMISEKRQVFFGWPYSAKIGSFHFTEIYKSDQYLKADKIVVVAKEFQIDYFVLDKEDLSPNDPMFAKEGIFEHIAEHNELGLYKIRK